MKFVFLIFNFISQIFLVTRTHHKKFYQDNYTVAVGNFALGSCNRICLLFFIMFSKFSLNCIVLDLEFVDLDLIHRVLASLALRFGFLYFFFA